MKNAKNLLFISVVVALIWAPMPRAAFAQVETSSQAAPAADAPATVAPATETAAVAPTEEPVVKKLTRAEKEAQIKADKKQWKKRLKQTEPMAFKKLVEDRESLQKELVETTDKLIIAEGKVKELNQTVSNMKSGQDFVQAVEVAKEEAGKAGQQRSHAKIDGVVFKVQIGSFRNKDLSKYLDNNPNFSGDIDQDGQRKYTLGAFINYWEADTFKKYLREMGVSDAWVVSYKDGQRVPIKDVLEGVVAMK